MTTQRNALKAIVGNKIKIERDGVGHVGVLAGQAYCRIIGKKVQSLRWVLITSDGEIHFVADARWLVEPVKCRVRRRSAPRQL